MCPIAYVGEQTFDLLRALVQPKTLEECKYANLVGRLGTSFCPPPNEIVLRFRSHSRVRLEGKTISDFVTDLLRLSAKWNFLELDNMICDRLVLRVTRLSAAVPFICAEAARKHVECIRTRPPDEISVDRLHNRPFANNALSDVGAPRQWCFCWTPEQLSIRRHQAR
ncbi:hypothetical protein TTRE_0000723201 [Trichuris trichiura]|uniref:Uncharacterized protein n=1 Tax=Trichuris trichiura TaxID=36087 RepID=A0A077ZEW8_TRITR|nr:hypothetical protein TTRE_0000723201 [Trichuris trichiura]